MDAADVTKENSEEDVSDLLDRLTDPCADMIELEFAPGPLHKPIAIQKAFLSSISPWFKAILDAQSTREDSDTTIRFGDAKPEVVKLFIYWLFHARVPGPNTFDTLDVEDETDYQNVLARAWKFADDRQIWEMRDAVTKVLGHSMRERKELSLDVFQEALRVSTRGSTLRKMLLREALWLEKHKGSKMLDQVIRTWLDGYDHDLAKAREEFDEGGATRGTSSPA